MPASPPEGTRDARLVEEEEAQQPPPSSSAHRRPTMELGADIYARATAPGVYPGLARELALRDVRKGASRTAAVGAGVVIEPVAAPLASERRAPASERRAPASERPPARLTEPLAMAYAPPGQVLPFESPGRAPSFESPWRMPSSPSTSFGPISAMTLQARSSLSTSERPAAPPPRASRLRGAAGVVLALGIAAVVVLLVQRSVTPAPVIETTVAAVVAPIAAPAMVTPRETETGTTPDSPSATAGLVEPAPTGIASTRSAGWRAAPKVAAPAETTAAPKAAAPAETARARHRLFDTEH